jgi:hypothetical protein
MPGFARVAGEYQGRVTFVAVDIGPYVGLGGHAEGARQLQITGTTYPAASATDQSALRVYGIQGTPSSVYFDRHGKIVRKVPGAFGEAPLRQVAAELAAAP